MAKDAKKLLAGFLPISDFLDQEEESFPQQQPAVKQASVMAENRKLGRPCKNTTEPTDTGDSMVVRLTRQVVLKLDYLRSKESLEANRKISRSEYIENLLPDIDIPGD